MRYDAGHKIFFSHRRNTGLMKPTSPKAWASQPTDNNMEPHSTAHFGDDVEQHALGFPVDTGELEWDDLEEAVHDQLPSLNEYNAKMGTPAVTGGAGPSISCIILLAIGIFTFLSLIFVSIGKREREAAMEFHDKTEAVVQFLLERKVALEPALRMNASPQRQAAQFIADGDAYRMAHTEDNAARFIDRYVLAVLWYQFGGKDWIYQLNFMSSSDVCDWYTRFTTANGDTIHEGVLCDEKNGRVQKIMLGKYDSSYPCSSVIASCWKVSYLKDYYFLPSLQPTMDYRVMTAFLWSSSPLTSSTHSTCITMKMCQVDSQKFSAICPS
jgi:hypothetical protein